MRRNARGIALSLGLAALAPARAGAQEAPAAPAISPAPAAPATSPAPAAPAAPGPRLLLVPSTPGVVYSDGFVLQSDWGLVRLYPRLSVTVDGRAAAGAGVSAERGTDGSSELSPRVVLRRALLELGGGALGYLDMKVSVELDGRGTYGDPLLPGAHDLKVGLPNAWINGEAGPALNLMVGMEPTPFSLENRTDPDDLVSLEPSLASQLAVPFRRALGACVWGESLHQHVSYDVMGIAAVGNTLPQSFGERGGAARFFMRPMATDRSRWDRLQLGVSGRWTVRDGQSADAPRDDLTTGNGFALFRRRFVDTQGRTQVILPSGAQRGLGFEAVSPVAAGLTLTGEAYVFADDTREAVESLAATTTERLGTLHGAGWYAQAAYSFADLYYGQRRWTRRYQPPYDLGRDLDVGVYPHPRRRDTAGVQSAIERLATVQLAVRAGRTDATYAPMRSADPIYGRAEPNSPPGRLDAWELGGTVSLWWTRIFRLSFSWQSYLTPDAGAPLNRAAVPGVGAGVSGVPGQWMHEALLRARMAL